MIYILKVRPVDEGDLSSSTPFLPEVDDYEMYVGALRDDLEKIDGIIGVVKNNSSLSIEIDESISEEELKKRVRPVFSEDLLRSLRFVSLVKS